MKAADKPIKIGDAPIQGETRNQMQAFADVLDDMLNGDKHGPDRKWGFCLLVFPFGDNPTGQHRANYISNARREDIVVLLKEQLARFEGQPAAKGTA